GAVGAAAVHEGVAAVVEQAEFGVAARHLGVVQAHVVSSLAADTDVRAGQLELLALVGALDDQQTRHGSPCLLCMTAMDNPVFTVPGDRQRVKDKLCPRAPPTRHQARPGTQARGTPSPLLAFNALRVEYADLPAVPEVAGDQTIMSTVATKPQMNAE